MSKRWLCIPFSLLLAGGLVGCASFLPGGKQTATYMDVFDTVCTVTVYGAEDFDAQETRFHEELQRYHRLFDIYNTYEGMNNLKTINDAAGGDPVTVEPPIIDLLAFGLEVYDLTDGRVNIAFGPVLRLWHDARAKTALPDTAALQAASGHADLSCLVINRQRNTVQLTDPDASLDVGALAKGFVAEHMADFATRELGWDSALLDIGGNIRAIGSKNGQPFKIGIRNPNTESAQTYLLTVGVTEGSVVTSGDYQRYFELDGKRYHHIIDRDTLYPTEYARSVSVLCTDSALADALSTALFAMSPEKGEALLSRIEGAEAVWMLSDGSLRYSDGFESFVLS